jgi:hypothetical protein
MPNLAISTPELIISQSAPLFLNDVKQEFFLTYF